MIYPILSSTVIVFSFWTQQKFCLLKANNKKKEWIILTVNNKNTGVIDVPRPTFFQGFSPRAKYHTCDE